MFASVVEELGSPARFMLPPTAKGETMAGRRLVLIVAAMGLIVLGACSGGDLAEQIIENQEGVGDVEIDEDTGEVSVETEDGSAVIGGGEIPAGFPIAVPDGGDVQAVFEQEGTYSISINYPDGFDDIVDFYTGWIEAQGIEVVNRTESSTPKAVAWTLQEGETGYSITVADIGDGSVQLTLITG